MLAYLAAASPAPAQPRYETVAQLQQTCADELARKVNGRCEAYLAGAAETLSAFGNGGSAAGICGRGVRSGELSRIFLAWATNNPHNAKMPRLAGVTMALRQRFPCRPTS
ncbi:Rap1a/Tai family immunity protein [Sphingomonas sp. SAFR-052]